MKPKPRHRAANMALIVGVILLTLCLLGFAGSQRLGGFIYFALLLWTILIVVSLVLRARDSRA